MSPIHFDKLLAFSDFHIGISKDAQHKVQTMLDTADWIIDTCHKQSINNVVFAGDWFHDRKSSSVIAINNGYKILDKFRKANINLFIIVGNHDLYYKNDSSVNSLIFFQEFSNVTVIDDQLEFQLGNKSGIMLAWEKLPANGKKYDICFTHMEFVGAKLAGAVSTIGYDLAKLSTIATTIYTGHYHLKNSYSFRDCDVISLGTSMELDWGDYQNPKGVHIIGADSCTFIENTTAPKHVKIYWSEVIAKRLDGLSQTTGNYVKLVIDVDNYKFEDILKVVKFINGKNPLVPCETEFMFGNSIKELAEQNSESLLNYEQFMSQSTVEQINSFVELQAKDENSVLVKSGLDVEEIKKLCSELYGELMEKKQ